ncbi:MAG: hypothetical protein ACXAD7_23715 [Candidatus Kariarchaeaceae archaeon]|jgi:lipopolysaccharide biosynthesis regulator YciM
MAFSGIYQLYKDSSYEEALLEIEKTLDKNDLEVSKHEILIIKTKIFLRQGKFEAALELVTNIMQENTDVIQRYSLLANQRP